MNLIIDIGNSSTKLALFHGDENIAFRRADPFTLGELQAFIPAGVQIEHCILSTVTSYSEEIREWLTTHTRFFELSHETPIPIKNGYGSPKTLGKDRLACAIAGATIFPDKNVLIINAGTCITYDFVDETNWYHGGAISPGMEMRFKALHTFTGKLPLITYKSFENIVGQTTEESILSGVINGITGEIESVVKQYTENYPGLHVILSGGDLINFDRRLKISIFAVPNIVTRGLHEILKFNVKISH